MPHPLLDAPASIRELLQIHEALRRLGYPAEQLYVVFAERPRPRPLVVLRVPGQRDFNIEVEPDPVIASEVALLNHWPRAARAWNTADDSVRLEIWARSNFVRGEADTELVGALVQRGLYPRTGV